MSNDSRLPFYHQQKEEQSEKLRVLQQKRQRIAWQRLLSVLLTFFLIYQIWNRLPWWGVMLIAITGIAIFLYLVSIDADAKSEGDNLQRLIQVLEKEIHIVNGQYQGFEGGKEYEPEHHVYAQDLDLFGTASLYQYINRCTSQQGKQLLATRMLAPLSKDEIKREQAAARELGDKPLFRHQLQATGMARPLRAQTEQRVMNWLTINMPFQSNGWDIVKIIYPFITFGMLALYMTDMVVAGVFYAFIFVCFLFAFRLSKSISPVYDELSDMANETETFYQQLTQIEDEKCASGKLLSLQQHLKSDSGTTASVALQTLHSILNRFNVRLNTLAFYFVNTFLLWDLWQLRSLQVWKKENEAHLEVWFRAIAEWEYSCSLAALYFNHSGWCVPHITTHDFDIKGSEIGHPLLAERVRVNNSFALTGTGKVAIITGSNMGGKSTFLRSLGVNIVLSLMGAPACARSFSLTRTNLMSSMRIADNLAENTSTFYAELKKLKNIIEAVNKGERVFILLDEILRGTNSLDRHTGSVALLTQFIHHKAVAVIATHDVELAKLQDEFPAAIENYHFDVQAEGNELYFDYKLKEGICRSMNASILMKNIGIEL